MWNHVSLVFDFRFRNIVIAYMVGKKSQKLVVIAGSWVVAQSLGLLMRSDYSCVSPSLSLCTLCFWALSKSTVLWIKLQWLLPCQLSLFIFVVCHWKWKPNVHIQPNSRNHCSILLCRIIYLLILCQSDCRFTTFLKLNKIGCVIHCCFQYEWDLQYSELWTDVFMLSSLLIGKKEKKGDFVQSFCGWMPFLSPTSRNHLLALVLSVSTRTPEQGKGVSLPLCRLSVASTHRNWKKGSR